ncbi:MAG: 7-cyano-7-deazaguanine synthase [Acidiferrobacteraceae bacterium]
MPNEQRAPPKRNSAASDPITRAPAVPSREQPSAVLLSGGIESTTLLHEHQHHTLVALFLNYGQRAARREALAAREQCDGLGIRMKILDARALGHEIGGLRRARFHVPLPQRNLFAIAAGVNWVSAAGGRYLYLGLNAEDAAHDASAAPHHVGALSDLMEALSGVLVAAPYLSFSKAEVVTRGISLGVDYGKTYSCLRGRKRHCGRCPQCVARRRAMAHAGAQEENGFYESSP